MIHSNDTAGTLPCLFNCSNDMALAANVRQYLPPKRIQQMETDLADLALVWAGTRFAGPWGWSLATKQRYRLMGVPAEQLPSDEWLDNVRRLSSRTFACAYLNTMLSALADERLLGEKMACSPVPSENERTLWTLVAPWLQQLPHWNEGATVFKSLWSSSGRGVFVSDTFDAPTQKRLQGFVSSQGGFVVDRFYQNKALDFAMEFFIHPDHTVEFLGYSVFTTGDHGAYGYNCVEAQDDLLKRIDVDPALLQQLVRYHQEHLGKIDYHGPVGIDMLKTTDGHIHPCIEINLRLNMGILALLLYQRHGAGATLPLTPLRAHGFQAVVDNGRLMIVFRP